MRTKAIIPFFGCALLLAVSCDVKDPIYNTPHPDHGTVTLTADWSRRGTDIDIPASYTVQAADYSTTLDGTTNRIDHLFEPGTYRFYIYNTPEQVSISGTTATVAAASGNWDGVGRVRGCLSRLAVHVRYGCGNRKGHRVRTDRRHAAAGEAAYACHRTDGRHNRPDRRR